MVSKNVLQSTHKKILKQSNAKENPVIAKQKAKELVVAFKEKYKFTCCKVLCQGLEGEEKRVHCAEMVEFCSDLLEDIIKVNVNG